MYVPCPRGFWPLARTFELIAITLNKFPTPPAVLSQTLPSLEPSQPSSVHASRLPKFPVAELPLAPLTG